MNRSLNSRFEGALAGLAAGEAAGTEAGTNTAAALDLARSLLERGAV